MSQVLFSIRSTFPQLAMMKIQMIFTEFYIAICPLSFHKKIITKLLKLGCRSALQRRWPLWKWPVFVAYMSLAATSRISEAFSSHVPYQWGCNSVILLRPKIGVEPPKHDVISMPTQQYTNTNYISLERSHLVVSIMLRYMDRIKTFNDNLSCREVKIDKKFWGDLPYFALKCDKFL